MISEETKSQIIITIRGKLLHIEINNQKRKNALNFNHLTYIMKSLEEAKANDNINCIYLTGKGDFFTSGNDFNNFSSMSYDEMANGFAKFIDYLIYYPKILIAGINGTCIGMGLTMLMHFDIILSSNNATFMVPFIQTFQVPEGTSSYLFPKLFGKLAGHLLYKGDFITSEEAKSSGLVTRIFDSDDFQKKALEYAEDVSNKPLKSLIQYKHMIKKDLNEKLSKVNHYEANELRKSWENIEFQAIINKFVKKPKF